MKGLTKEERDFLIDECKSCSGPNCNDRELTAREAEICRELDKRYLVYYAKCRSDREKIHPVLTSVGHSVLEMVRLSESSVSL